MVKWKHIFLLLCLVLVSGYIDAQRIRPGRNAEMACTSIYPNHRLSSTSVQYVHQYASNFLKRDRYSSLRLKHHTSSKTGQHYLFDQYVNGIKLVDHFVKVNCSNDGVVRSAFHHIYYCLETPPTHSVNVASTELLLQNLLETKSNIQSSTPVYVLRKNQLVSAALIDHEPGNCQHFHSIMLEEDALVHRDMVEYLDGDTLIRVKVFYPDPLTSSGQYYGGNYVDNNDADINILNNQRVLDTCTGDFSNGNFTLSNSFVTIAEHSPPVTNIPSLAADSFYFTRAQEEFEDVNAFYHITRIKQHINKLGYNTLVNYQIRVDAHGLNGTDNSTFNTGPNPPELTYGEGGVDDAEDADVIVHEYTHAISHSAAPGTNSGTERQNLEEANCDYMAASYSRNINPFRWQDVYTWDGHNQYWNGRLALTTKNYGSITFGGNIYEHTDLWAGVLMELWGDLGRNLNDELLLESMHGYAPGMSMQDAAHLFVLADSTLYGGANHWKICPRFYNRGLLSNCTTLGLIDKRGFPKPRIAPNPSQGNITVFIESEQNESVSIEIISSDGKTVLQHVSYTHEGRNEIRLNSQLPAGLYFVRVSSETQLHILKITIL